MKVSIEGKELVIRMPLQKPKPSGSGKNLVIATTGGNKATDCKYKDLGPITVGVNAYVKNDGSEE